MIKYYNFVMLHIYIYTYACASMYAHVHVYIVCISICVWIWIRICICVIPQTLAPAKKTSRNLRRSHRVLHVFATSANHFPHLSCFILHVWNT